VRHLASLGLERSSPLWTLLALSGGGSIVGGAIFLVETTAGVGTTIAVVVGGCRLGKRDTQPEVKMEMESAVVRKSESRMESYSSARAACCPAARVSKTHEHVVRPRAAGCLSLANRFKNMRQFNLDASNLRNKKSHE